MTAADLDTHHEQSPGHFCSEKLTHRNTFREYTLNRTFIQTSPE